MGIDCHGSVKLNVGDLWAISCQKCGFVHRHPLPPPQEQAAAYRDIYGRGEADLLEQRASDLWYWRLVFAERMREFERLTEGLPEVHPYAKEGFPGIVLAKYILDWGAGCGRFTDYVEGWRPPSRRAWRWWAWGYEPCKEAASHAQKSHLVFSGHPTLWTGGNMCGQYHAVHCSLVLEHVRDPVTVLRQMRGMLMDGGALCVVVPNEFNPLQRKLTERWRYSPFAQIHLNYFAPATLRHCIERAGFEVLATEATFPMEWLALHGLNYVKYPYLGRWAHRLRMLFEAALVVAAPEVKRWLYRRWGEMGIGREVIIWARKPQ